MRAAAATMLAMLTTGGLSLAMADPPGTPVAAESQSTAGQRGSTEESTTPHPPARTELSRAPAAAQAAAAAPPKPASSTTAEQMLRSEGYKLTMVHGQEKYCRRETATGSHIAAVQRCVTAEEAEMMAKEARETTERIQRNTPGCLAGPNGAVCH